MDFCKKTNNIRHYLKSDKPRLREKKIGTYLLDSFNPLTQYTFLLPFLFFYFKEFGFINRNPTTTYKLMTIHRSQFNWYRKLHTLFSGYAYFNSYTKIELVE